MKLNVRGISKSYQSVTLTHEDTTISLGVLDADGSRELAKELVDAVWALGPSDYDQCLDWLKQICVEVDIKWEDAH